MRFAARYPQSVKRLALLVSAHRFSAKASGWPRLKGKRSSSAMGGPWFTREARDPAETLRDYWRLLGTELQDNAENVRRFLCPALLIAGTTDQFFNRAEFEQTVSMIPNARLVFFERETHMLPLECADAVEREIQRLVRER